MRYVPVEEARKHLGKLVRDVAAGEPVIVGRRGVEQAVLISEEEYERLRRIEEHAARARFREALDAISAGVRTRRLPQKVVVEALRAARRPWG
jgi:prevent-host-death family protein